MATDGSLLGKTGKWRACGWAVVWLSEGRTRGPAHHQEAELTAFLCLSKRVIGPGRIDVDNKGIIDGLRRGESKCIKPRAGDADLWIEIWEHGLAERGILVEVEHVWAHRTKREKKKMSQFERFLTEGNEKADELAKAGAMLDKGVYVRSKSRNDAV